MKQGLVGLRALHDGVKNYHNSPLHVVEGVLTGDHQRQSIGQGPHVGQQIEEHNKLRERAQKY